MNKIQECNELINHINETFNVDLRNEKTDGSVIWFRYYIIEKYKNEILKVSYLPLNKTHGAISYLRNRLHLKTKTQQYKDIVEVIESNDIEKYKFFIAKHVKKRYDDKRRNIDLGAVKKMPMSVGAAMELLRKNKKSLLWNKKISSWNYVDWSEIMSY